MKIYRVDISDEVHNFIYEQADYVFRISFSQEASQNIFNMLYKEIFSLKVFPNRFPIFNNKYRVFTIKKKFRVFYKVDEENLIVTVNQIFSSYENYENINF